MGIGLFAYANHGFFMNYLKQSKIPENQYTHNTFLQDSALFNPIPVWLYEILRHDTFLHPPNCL